MRLLGLFLYAGAAMAQPTIDAYLTSLAEDSFKARDLVVARLDRAGAEARQKHIRQRMVEEIGGFPVVKSPLNPRITGSFKRSGYRVDNLIYESQPNFKVTANVYVPVGSGPFPALVGVAGHSANGKASSTYQHVWISLAKRGFLVLAFDPAGQGERSETFDADTQASRAGIGTSEHTMAGAQCLLTGTAYARYETYDGIRAVDYLLTRPDVDPKRIAVAGNSGGGTQSSYLSVFEPRLAAVVSSCYMTSWKQLWFKPGPQDAEQVFPGFLRDGFDFGDFAFAAAPKPFMMTTAIQDFFPILGARNTHQEIRKFFSLFDVEAKAGYFEYDDTHGWSKPRREAAYRWFGKWLAGKDDDGTEGEVETEPEQLLYATPTGQLVTSGGSATVQSLNAVEAKRVYASRGKLTREAVERRLAFDALESRPAFHEFTYREPSGPGKYPAVLAINAANADIDGLVNAGHAVMNLRLNSSSPRDVGYTSQYQTASRAILLGKTLVGLEVSDVMKALRELKSKPRVDSSRIRLYGRGTGAVVALHSAYLNRDIHSVALEAMPVSYLAITQARYHRGLIEAIIPGVLKDYDLPDLVTNPSRTWLADTRTPAGAMMKLDEVKALYRGANVQYRPEGWAFTKVYQQWLK